MVKGLVARIRSDELLGTLLNERTSKEFAELRIKEIFEKYILEVRASLEKSVGDMNIEIAQDYDSLSRKTQQVGQCFALNLALGKIGGYLSTV